MEAVLLGHYGLPEQTPPEAARDQFEDAAWTELDALAAEFAEAGVEVTTRLLFGQDYDKAIDQVAIEEDCDAELAPAPTEGIRRILVPLPDAANLERLSDYVRALVAETTANVTLLHVVEGEAVLEDGGSMLDEARSALVEGGFDTDLVETELVEGGPHDEVIFDAAGEYDAVVMGEASPAVADRVFGTLPERIVREVRIPVVVVRRHG